MNTAAEAPTMNDEVSISIRKIENGWILDQSWREKKKSAKEGCCDTEYKSEQHFMKELPEGFNRYMIKGTIGEESPKDMDEADARADYILNKKEDIKEDKEEEKE
jgi:hypothetical protein